MRGLYWWFWNHKKLVGEQIIEFGDKKPDALLVQKYIDQNLELNAHSFPLGNYPAFRLMKIYDLLKEWENDGTLEKSLGYFQYGDTWEIVRITNDEGKRVWAIKIYMKDLYLREEIMTIYKYYYNVPFKRARVDFLRDIEIFLEFINQSAMIAGKYIKLNKKILVD